MTSTKDQTISPSGPRRWQSHRRIAVSVIGLALLALVTLVPASPAAGASGQLTATATTDLVDLQTITLSGRFFTPGAEIAVCQIEAGHGFSSDGCGALFTLVNTTVDGSFNVDAQVRQLMFVQGHRTDCRETACAVAAAEVVGLTLDPNTAVELPVTFAAAPPPPATRGTITVTPNTDLADGQDVTVAGVGFRPNVPIEIFECGATAPVDQFRCTATVVLTSDAAGAFSTPYFRVSDHVQPVDDCHSAPGACSIGAGETADVASTIAVAPLGFDVGPFPGVITVTPATTLADGQRVTVAGSNFDPGAIFGVCQVPASFVVGDTCGSNVEIGTVSGSGTFSVTYTVRRVLDQPTPGLTDCAFQTCKISVGEAFRPRPSIVMAPLAFAPVPPKAVPGVGTWVAEGDAGTTTIEVPVHLTGASTSTVTVPWTTLVVPGAPAGQADPTTDYVAASGTVVFAPGVTDIVVTITIVGDTTVESDEYVVVSFDHPTNAVMGGFWGLGFGVIGNDD